MADGGRLVVSPAYRRDPAHRVLALLFARLWLEANGRGFEAIAASTGRALMRTYRRLGLAVEVLGPPRSALG